MPIFQDHFLDNRNGWEEREDGRVTLRIGAEDYAYLFEHKQEEGLWTTWQPFDVDDALDYKIHAVIERVSGGNFGYGLLWRCADEQNGYSFEISGSGYYRVCRCVEGDWTAVRPWTLSPHIKQGERTINELTVVVQRDRAIFYANNEWLDEMALMGHSPNDGFGFVVNGRLKIRIHATIVLRHLELPRAQAAEDAAVTADIASIMAELDKLVGLETIKQEIRTFINYLRVQKFREGHGLPSMPLTYHMVLAGPPGTGKTTVARLIGRIYKELGFLSEGHVVETDRAGLVAPYVGQTALKVQEMVEKALGGILFVDEAYSLMPKGGGQGNDFGQEAIEALLKRMEDHRGQFALVIAGYGDEIGRFLDANPGVKSRFNRYFYFEHYKPDELLAIYEKFCANLGLRLSAEARARLQTELAKAYAARGRSFGNGRFVRNLLEKTVERQANRIVDMQPMTAELLAEITFEDIPELDDYTLY